MLTTCTTSDRCVHWRNMKKYQNIEQKKLERSEVEVTGEITSEAFEHAYKHVLKHAVESADISGFRAGKAPESVVIKHIGEPALMERAAREAIDEVFPDIADELKIRAISTPMIAVTKIARNNPLGFKARIATMPEVEIGDYKKVAAEVKPVDESVAAVTEKEVTEVIDNLRNMFAHQMAHGNEPHDHGAHDHDHSHELPELTDEFAQKLGDYKTVADLKKGIEENVLASKRRELKERRRGEIAEKIIAAAKIDVPEVLIGSELESMMHQFKHDVERSGATFPAYLAEIKKTEDEVKKEWRDNAEKKAKLELILGHIARTENIVPVEDEVKAGVEEIVKRHKDVDRFHARMHVERVLRNSATLEFLENQGQVAAK